jgi:hypothetical protein
MYPKYVHQVDIVHTSVIPATWETEIGESLESRSLRPTSAIYRDTILKKKNPTNWNRKINFFFSTGAWTQGLHLEPLPQPFFCDGFFFFKIGSHKLFALGRLQTDILLISASWVARDYRCEPLAPGWNRNFMKFFGRAVCVTVSFLRRKFQLFFSHYSEKMPYYIPYENARNWNTLQLG